MTTRHDTEGPPSPSTDSVLSVETQDGEPQSLVNRIYSFRSTFVVIAGLILLYTFTIRAVEAHLLSHFENQVRDAIEITNYRRPVTTQIQMRINYIMKQSLWISIGGVHVSPTILGRDGSTLIYVSGGRSQPPAERYIYEEILLDAERLLPATAYLSVSVPHNSILANSILIVYAALAMQLLWLRSLANARHQRTMLEEAMENRVKTEQRASTIEAELDQMRRQFQSIESTDPEHISEVNQLRDERKTLESKLTELEFRELELRDSTARASELGREIHALEDLLEEASEDLESRDDAIRDLETSLKRASKDVANQEAGRAREADVLSKRYGTLYRNVEVDDRALQDIVALRDDAMKLKCEEKLKRLNDEAENVSVRRKVGGIPPHLTIFEMGFAGKGRIYYMKGSQRRFRVLNVGAKNTQNAAIEYLRKL
jgi:hypothetical protein